MSGEGESESGSQKARKGTLSKSGKQEDVYGVTYDTISCLPAFLSIFSWLPGFRIHFRG
jgi:hypothetical protein